jgi:multiple sugar transport system permease protein
LPQPLWLSQPWAARTAILITDLWLALPFDILVLVAALSSQPREPLEAARVDGATRFQTFRYVTLPALRPALAIILVIRIADAFRIFDVIYILTNSGPGNSTDVVSTFIFRITFTNLDFAHGAAASILLVLIIALCAGAAARMLRPRGVEWK